MSAKNRDFKGIWIPKEIYLDDNLNWTEKILLVEIDSLDNEKGCFASNGYFADFLGKSEVYISNCISKLKEEGYIYQESFNGRQRVLRSNLKYVMGDFKAGLNSSLRQGKTKVKGRRDDDCAGNQGVSGGKSGSNNTNNNKKTEEEEAPTPPVKLSRKFRQVFGRDLSADLYQKLLKIYSNLEILMRALEISEQKGDKPVYLLKILADWKENGLTSVSEINKYLKNRQAGKANNSNQNLSEKAKKLHDVEYLEENGWN